MKHIQTILEEKLREMAMAIFPDTDLSPFSPLEITQTSRIDLGHYQCNSAMKMSSSLRITPREVGNFFVNRWKEFPDSMIAHMEVAGPGFINIFLSKEYLSERLTKMIRKERFGIPSMNKRKKVIVDFSSPNIAKELHVGHLRSTIIGESLSRLLEFLGYEVVRLNHIGDFGTQFGMLLQYLKEKEPTAFSKEDQPTLSSLMHWYREAKKMFDQDEEFKKRAQLRVVSLQSKEKESVDLFEQICNISRKGFQEVYALLQVDLEERGESFYAPWLPQVIADFEEKRLLTHSEGAKCAFLEGFVTKEKKPLPLILQKSDGGYNYATTDLAALYYRVNKDRADRILYVVDGGQRLHFEMVFQAAKQVGYYSPKAVDVSMVLFGVVLGPDGKKFKTRSGTTEKLIDLLDQAVEKAKEVLKERLKETSSKEIDDLAKILGIDAVKYADLSCHRLKDYLFSYEKMLRFDGNTASYLLYSYVRIESIKRKVQKEVSSLIERVPIVLEHPAEVALGLRLGQFGEALSAMDRELLPNRLADYLYSLAEAFHKFFQDCRVHGGERENARLVLCELTSRVLKKGLFILGLQTLPRM